MNWVMFVAGFICAAVVLGVIILGYEVDHGDNGGDR